MRKDVVIYPWFLIVLVLGLVLSFALVEIGFWVLAFLFFVIAFIFCVLYFEQALFVASFLLPFEKTLAFEIKGITLRVSHLWLILIFLAWLFRGLVSKQLVIKGERAFVYLVLYFGVAMLSLNWAQNLKRGVEVLLFTLFAFFAFWLLFQILTQKKDYYFLFLKGLFWGALVASVFGLLQYLGDWANLPLWLTGIGKGYTKAILGFPRVRATFSEPLYWGSFIVMVWPLVYFQVYSPERIWPKRRLKLLLLLLLVNLFLTVARSAYLAFLVQAFVIAFISFVKQFRVRKVYWLSIVGIMLFALLFAGINFPKFLPPKVQGLISHATSTSDWSTKERLMTWESAMKAFRKSPLKGLGIGQFGPYWAGYPHGVPLLGWQTVNNQPLEILAETGVFGLLFFVLFYLYLVWIEVYAWRKSQSEWRALAKGFLIGLVGLAIQWQFFSTLYIVYLFVLFALALTNAFYAVRST